MLLKIARSCEPPSKCHMFPPLLYFLVVFLLSTHVSRSKPKNFFHSYQLSSKDIDMMIFFVCTCFGRSKHLFREQISLPPSQNIFWKILPQNVRKLMPSVVPTT
ncbi:hypothetical protein B0J14DRAFT_4267 [Halenospora varia]|nr:hypothetical protein B0J14DRAFT_4267 [Halenospora varia]